MYQLIDGDITYMSDVDECNLYELRDHTNAVIGYLCAELGVKRNDFKVNIIITKDFQKLNRYYTCAPANHTVDACMVNRHSITNSDAEKKDVIVMKWELYSSIPNEITDTLILLHELVHHLDYQLIERVNSDFSLDLFLTPYDHYKTNLEKCIHLLFMARSEMRAYYYEEQHWAIKNKTAINIDQVKSMSDDFNDIKLILSRLLGKIRYWEENNVHKDSVKEAYSYIQTGSPMIRDWEQYIKNSFTYNEFCAVCNYFVTTVK